MIRSRTTLFVIACLALASAQLSADVRTEEKTRVELGGVLGRMLNIFGGKAAREGVTSTVAVKGSRKITLNDTSGQIIDLSEETVYDLDMRRKTYSATTFAELRRRLQEARQKAAEAARQEQEKDKTSVPPAATQNEKDIEVVFDVRNTGQTKTINGFNTRQAIATVTAREKGKTLEQSGGLVVTTDLWLAPTIAAMKEVIDFDMRYAQQLYGPMVTGASAQDMAAAMALYPMIKPVLERMNAEVAKIDGTAITTVVTMEAVKSAEQVAQEQADRQGDSKVSASGGVGGLLGGLTRRAAQRKVQGDVTPRATFMTATTEVLKVTTDVKASEMAIPEGFKRQ
jgi:hypothetical protein